MAKLSFGDELVARGLITPENLLAARSEQTVTKERIGKILVRNGFVRQDDVFKLILERNPNQLHDEAVFQSGIPANILLETQSMIVARANDTIYVSTISSPRQVRRRFEPFIGNQKLVLTAANPIRLADYLIKTSAQNNSNTLTWERIFYQAMARRASDIHIIPRHASYSVMLRQDGVMHLIHEGELKEYISLVSRVKDLAKMDMAERRRAQDGGFSLEHTGRLVSFRVLTLPTVNGERMVVRILDPDAVNMRLDKLGITELATWRRVVSYPDGLCLICGPTGSGKSTTLAATVREMNFLERVIYTVEDPVENLIPYAGQVNVNPTVGLDFSNSVRAFMRGDPDVILVGEVRDLETARNVIKSAETGHLAMATLHTDSIINTVARLRDIGVAPYELRHVLRGVMVQRLIRVFCSHCGGKGCKICNGSGLKGREVVSEVVQCRNEKDVDALIEGKISWTPMIEDAYKKVKAGRTSMKELERVFGDRISQYTEDLAQEEEV